MDFLVDRNDNYGWSSRFYLHVMHTFKIAGCAFEAYGKRRLNLEGGEECDQEG